MKKEYDFSKGVRSKFYRPNVRLNLPISLDDDIAAFVRKYAKQKKVDAQIAVNEVLHRQQGNASGTSIRLHGRRTHAPRTGGG